MNGTPQPRSLDQINQEYSQLCAQFGDKYVRIKTFEADCQNLLVKIEALAKESAESEKLKASESL